MAWVWSVTGRPLCRLHSQRSLIGAASDLTIGSAGAQNRRFIKMTTEQLQSHRQAVIAICLAGDERVQGLNRDFRGRDRPTNVLSFPGGEEDGPAGQDGQPFHLGDIILSLQTMQREAAELKIPLRHHLAHLVIHGVLHLLGHDHVEDEEAEQMERLERAAMHSLGLPPPPQ